MTKKNGCLLALLVGLALVILAVLSSRTHFSKFDLTKLPRRAMWQRTDEVIESLDLEPGDHVADIGAGDGYFTWPLADAVGPTGRVYAVEVEEDKVKALEEKVRENGYSNVEVVFGEFADPLLPDGSIDLVFLCDTYHHIDGRNSYFSRLKTDLSEDGRVAIVEVGGELSGFVRFLSPPGHSTARAILHREMESADYVHERSFDFLPVHNLEVFTVAGEH